MVTSVLPQPFPSCSKYDTNNIGSKLDVIRSLPVSRSELGGLGHDFGHEFVSESVSEADSDTRFFWTLDTDSDMDSGKVMTSDTDLGWDMDTSENLGHGFGLGHDFGIRKFLRS